MPVPVTSLVVFCLAIVLGTLVIAGAVIWLVLRFALREMERVSRLRQSVLDIQEASISQREQALARNSEVLLLSAATAVSRGTDTSPAAPHIVSPFSSADTDPVLRRVQNNVNGASPVGPVVQDFSRPSFPFPGMLPSQQPPVSTSASETTTEATA